jgi:hypothetical protein
VTAERKRNEELIIFASEAAVALTEEKERCVVSVIRLEQGHSTNPTHDNSQHDSTYIVATPFPPPSSTHTPNPNNLNVGPKCWWRTI